MRWTTVAPTAIFLFVAFASYANTGIENGPVIALHASRAFSKSLCDAPQVPSSCEDFIVSETTQRPFNVYLVATKVDSTTGIGGLSCGISMSGSLAILWNLCADTESQYMPWPRNGGGNRIAWDTENCQRTVSGDGVQAVAGFFYVYVYDNSSLGITQNSAAGDSQLIVADCSDNDIPLEIGGGIAGFGTESGFNPCSIIVKTEERTWGNLKARFGNRTTPD
jgi:hypothetical protein